MQPPSRKVTECQQVKLKFAGQLSKLQLKHHRDSELLQEIRSFSKQRASIEREYGQALQKLASHFQKRDWQKGNSEAHNSGVSEVWRSLLDAIAKSAASRLAAAGDYRKLHEHICSNLRNAKDSQVKRSLKDLQNVQEEVVAALKELNGIKRQYQQLAHIANVARGKAADAQKKTRKHENGIFHFQSGQNKMTAKLCARWKECDERLIKVRNEYLLTLAAVNTHDRHYYTEDLPRMIQKIDGDIYDSLRSHFSVLCGTEMEMCVTIHEQYSNAWDGVIKLTSETNMQQFLQDSDLFMRTTDFTFQPAPQDQVCVLQDICAPEEDGWLRKEAKTWVAKAANDYKTVTHGERVLETLTGRANILTGDAAHSLEQKIAEVQSSIWKTTLSRVKAEARLAVLAQSVEGTGLWLDSAMTQADQELERHKRFSERRQSAEEFSRTQEDDLIYFEEEDDEKGDIFSDPASTSTTNQSDEHSIVEGEELQVVEDGEMEDWLEACDSCGQVGHVLEHYVHFLCLPAEDVSLQDTSPCLSNTGEQAAAVRRDVARALYSYQAQSVEELSFQEGALIRITREVGKGFWEGELSGRIGVFPSVLVELIEEQEGEEEDVGKPPCGPLTLRSTDLDGEKTVVTELPSLPDEQPDAGGDCHNSPALCRSRLRPCRAPPPPPTRSSHRGTDSTT